MQTHMPFLYPGGVLFAAGEMPPGGGAVRWKLMAGSTLEDARPLVTGLPDHVIECSPSLTHDGGGVELVFVAQDGDVLRFYAMRGGSIAHLTPAVPLAILGRDGAHAGTRSSAFAAVDRPEVAGVAVEAFHAEEPTLISYAALGLDAVARITFDYAHPWRMLVSGPSGETWHTALYDLKTEEVRRVVLADGSGVYKASILGDRMVYAARLSEVFEAREIRFAEYGEWRLEPIPAPETSPLARVSVMSLASEESATTTASIDPTVVRRERTLRANCAVGSFCRICRRHADTRADLETLGIVDRAGDGCPRGLPWDVSDAALDAIRPFLPGGDETAVWCERFMVGITPAQCQRCVDVRASGDADAAGAWLQGMADARVAFSCEARAKTENRRVQACCGQAAKEVAVYVCASRDAEVAPADCAACALRVPVARATASTEAVPC